MPDRTWLAIGHSKLDVTFLAHAQAGHGLSSVMSMTMTVCCSCLAGHGLLLSCRVGNGFGALLMPDRTWLLRLVTPSLDVTFLAHAQAGHGLSSVMSMTMTVCCSCLAGHGLLLSCRVGNGFGALLMPDRTWLLRLVTPSLDVTFLAHAQAGHGLSSVMSRLTMTVMLLMPSWPWLLCALRLCVLLLPQGFAHCFCPEALHTAFAEVLCMLLLV